MSLDLETALENIDALQADLYASLEEKKRNAADKLRSQLEIALRTVLYHREENELMVQNGIKLSGTEEQREILRAAVDEYNETGSVKRVILKAIEEQEVAESPKSGDTHDDAEAVPENKELLEQSANNQSVQNNTSVDEKLHVASKNFKSKKNLGVSFWFSHSVNAAFALTLVMLTVDFTAETGEAENSIEVSQKGPRLVKSDLVPTQIIKNVETQNEFIGEGIVFVIESSTLRIAKISNGHEAFELGLKKNDTMPLFANDGALRPEITNIIFDYTHPKDFIRFMLRHSRPTTSNIGYLQASLNKTEYEAGKEDGILGPKTAKAILNFINNDKRSYRYLPKDYIEGIQKHLNEKEIAEFQDFLGRFPKHNNLPKLQFGYQ